MNVNDEKPLAKTKVKKKISLSLIIYVSFALVLATVCFIIFLVKMDYALSTGGDYFPDFFIILLDYLIVCATFTAIAVIIKEIFKKTRISILLILALLLPWVQYYVNFQLFTGPLAFIPEGDFNFDGVNDEIYRKRTEYREVSSTHTPDKSNPNSPPFEKVEAIAYGRGETFDHTRIFANNKYHPSNRSGYIHYYADLNTNEITSLDIYITPNHPSQNDFTLFYIVVNEGYDNEEYIKPLRELLDDGRIKLSLSELDIEHYRSLTKSSDIKIIWKYTIV